MSTRTPVPPPTAHASLPADVPASRSKPLTLRKSEVPPDRGQRVVMPRGEVLCRQCPGFERGDVPKGGVLARTGALALDLDEAEDVGSGGLNRSPRPWCSGRRGRGCGRD